MATTSVTSDQDSIISEIEIAAPPERVFQALARPDQLMRWWTSDVCRAELWELDARPGGRWRSRLKSDSMTINGTKVFEPCGEILEIDPPRLLVYTWKSNWDPQPAPQSVVRWELTPNGSGTRVKMTHSKLTPQLAKDYAGGWSDVVAKLKNFAENQQVRK